MQHADEALNAVIVAGVLGMGWLLWLKRPLHRRLVLSGVILLLSVLWPGPRPGSSGDAPHYEMLARSIAHGRLAVDQSYAEHRFDSSGADQHVVLGSPRARRYSKHLPGFPLLAAPLVRWMDGRALVVVSGLATLGALLLGARTAERLGAAKDEATIAAAAALLTPAVLGFARAGFSEALVGAGLAALALWTIESGRLALVAASVGAFALPFTHLRSIAPAAVLLVLPVLTRRRLADLAPLALLGAGSIAVLGMFQFAYGTWSPSAPYSGTADAMVAPSLRSLVGVLGDDHAGLFFAAPIAIFGLIVTAMTWRRAPVWSIGVLGAFASTYLLGATWRAWPLGVSPPGRLWVALVPLVIPGIVLGRRRRPRMCLILVLLGALMAIANVVIPYGGYPSLDERLTLFSKVPLVGGAFNVASRPPFDRWSLLMASLLVVTVVLTMCVQLRPARAQQRPPQGGAPA